MPVRNGEEFIEEALNSLLSQTFRDFELIISDNASDDRTPAICREFVSRDPRVSYHRFKRNVGAARNFNNTFELARGEFFKWAAHDDVCLPRLLERCLGELTHTPCAVVAYPRTELIDAEGRVTGVDNLSLAIGQARAHDRLRNLYRRMRLGNPVFGLMRSDALRKTRLHGSFISSDTVLLAELLMLGEFREVPEILFRRRLHEQRSLKANRTRQDLLAWFDPSKRNHRLWVTTPIRISWECTSSIFRFRMLSLSDRIGCLAVTVRWKWWGALGSAAGRLLQEARRLLAVAIANCSDFNSTK